MTVLVSGFELPDGAYGIVVVTVIQGQGQPADLNGSIIGNFRVIDNSGYEYRTNSQSPSSIVSFEDFKNSVQVHNYEMLRGYIEKTRKN